MVRPKLSIATRCSLLEWINRKNILISRRVRKYQQTNDVENTGRQGHPPKTSSQEDRASLRLVRRYPFSKSTILRDNWIPNRAISTRTVRNRVKTAGYRARRHINIPFCTSTQNITFVMVSGTSQMEYFTVEKDSLVWWKLLSSAHDWSKNSCVEATKCRQLHQGNNSIGGRSVMVWEGHPENCYVPPFDNLFWTTTRAAIYFGC